MALQVSYDPDTGLPVVVSDGHVVLTGPHTGDVKVKDGTTYNVTAPFIEVESQEHAEQVAAALDKKASK